VITKTTVVARAAGLQGSILLQVLWRRTIVARIVDIWHITVVILALLSLQMTEGVRVVARVPR
jgi:hypothetical protein